MKRISIGGSLILVVLLTTTGIAVRADDENTKPDKDEKKERLVPAGQVTGVLRSAEGGNKYLTIGVNQRSIRYSGYGRPSIQTQQVNVEVQPTEDMEVRTMQPPQAFDEKGNPKRYNAKELRELRGKSRLPGFTADLSALKSGQTVLVYLARPAKMPAPRRVKKGEEDELTEYKPLVTAVIILGEAREW